MVRQVARTYSDDTAVQHESLALGVHDVAVLLALSLGHEGGLVEVGVELLGLALLGRGAGVEALEAVLLQGVHQDVLSHLEAVDQVQQVLVGLGSRGAELVGRHGEQCAVEVVDALQQVHRETLDGKVAGAVHVALGALLEVEEVGHGADIFVLLHRVSMIKLVS